MKNKNIQNAVKNSYFVLAFSVLGIFVGYLLRIFLSKSMSIEEFGLFYAVSAFIGLFTLIRYLGLNQALTKHIPEFLIKREKSKIKSSVVFVLIVQTITILIFTGIILLFQKSITSTLFRSSQAGTVLILMTLSFFPSMFFTIFQSVFQGYQKLKTYALVEPIRILLTFFFSVLFISMGAIGVALAYLIAAIATTLLFTNSFYRLGLLQTKTKIASDLVKKLVKFSAPVFISSIAIIVIQYTDTLAITFFRSLEEVALYQIALPTSLLLSVFSSSVAAVAFPLMSELYSRRKFLEIERGVRVITVLLLLTLLPFVMILFSFPEIIIRLLFSEAFINATVALQLLAISMIFYSIFAVFQMTLDGIGRPFSNTKIIFSMAAANFILNIILVPAYGINGAAFASLISYFLGMVIGFTYVKKYLNVSVPVYRLTKIFFSAIISTALIILLKLLIQMPAYLEFIIVLVFGWLVYVALIIITRSISSKDIEFIESMQLPATIKSIVRLIFGRRRGW